MWTIVSLVNVFWSSSFMHLTLIFPILLYCIITECIVCFMLHFSQVYPKKHILIQTLSFDNENYN